MAIRIKNNNISTALSVYKNTSDEAFSHNHVLHLNYNKTFKYEVDKVIYISLLTITIIIYSRNFIFRV